MPACWTAAPSQRLAIMSPSWSDWRSLAWSTTARDRARREATPGVAEEVRDRVAPTARAVRSERESMLWLSVGMIQPV